MGAATKYLHARVSLHYFNNWEYLGANAVPPGLESQHRSNVSAYRFAFRDIY